jgi:predicted ribosome quality control (RQC) complex YloA/Tae2 family protein
MHNNYYFLRKLSHELESKLLGTVVSECFSQHKEELIIRFETRAEPFIIKASLQASFACLSFPGDYNRARKNSIDLFEPLLGQRVTRITQYENERSFSVEFSNGFTLLFKMHSSRSNLVLFQDDTVIEIFRNHLTVDNTIQLAHLSKNIDWSFEVFESNLNNLPALYITFGKPVWNFLSRNGFDEKSNIEQWQSIQDLRNYLNNPTFYISKNDGKIMLSLFPDGTILTKSKNAIEVCTEFYFLFSRTASMREEKNQVLSQLKNKLAGSVSYLIKAYEKKREIEKNNHYKVWADVLMANLHQVKTGMEKISLPDFYNQNKPIEIKLKKEASAQKNAEIFYRKSKNRQIEILKLNESISAKETEVRTLKAHIDAVNELHEVKAVRGFIETNQLAKELQKKEAPLPYHEVEFMGFKIWIGKNAQHNDTLTLRYTYKEDLWLHAKDVAGSHVVIKYQSGKKFPKEVIERAAQLAAYNSKRKTDSLCPVAYTPKKYVRKRKGDPPGSVVVEREEVILVEPRGI